MSGQPLAFVAGSQPPAMSISWERPLAEIDSGFIVFFSDIDPADEDPPAQPICLHCLTEDGDEQLGRGLDLAREHGLVAWDDEREEWFVPDDE